MILLQKICAKTDAFLMRESAHDFAVDVGEAKFASLIAVGQPFVVEPPKMQDRDVEIVRVNR